MYTKSLPLCNSGAIQALYGKHSVAATGRINSSMVNGNTSSLIARQKLRFLASKCEKTRREKIR